MVYRIKMLPAEQGDCIIIEYGDLEPTHRIMIDGGTRSSILRIEDELNMLPDTQRTFELLIVTHIDGDHIGGILELLGQQYPPIGFRDIWFNSWKHLRDSGVEEFGPVEGERLTSLLVNRGLPWNEYFNGASISVPDKGILPRRSLPGGMSLMVLSPDATHLCRLSSVWEEICQRAGLHPGGVPQEPTEIPEGFEVFGEEHPDVTALSSKAFEGDNSEANGSSISVLAEFEGKCALLAADSYSDVLEAGIIRFQHESGRKSRRRIRLDAFKLPHHGSSGNLGCELLKRVDCSRYLFSTNGKVYGHPDREAVARVIVYGGKNPELVFNYRTRHNRIWDDGRLRQQYHYCTRYPQEASDCAINL